MELLLYSSSLLLLLCSSQGLYSTEAGRTLHYKLVEAPEVKIGEGTAMSAAVIGSRPPRCEGKCLFCSHCEAVQVPVAPQGKGEAGKSFRTVSARADESYTNYKPLNWKCRCGDRVLNP